MTITAPHSQPYQTGDRCIVTYLHAGQMIRSSGEVMSVRQLPYRQGWMVAVRADDTGFEVDTTIDANGHSPHLSPTAPGVSIPSETYVPARTRPPSPGRPGQPTAQTRVMITVQGPQQVTVTTHNRQPGDGRPAVVVTVAGVMTVCHGPDSVGARARSWNEAVALAEQGHLPPAARQVTYDDTRAVTAAILATEGAEHIQVTTHSHVNSPDGHADVIVRIGALSIRCLDTDALIGIAAAWADADRLARILWGAEAIAARSQR